jgi:hypothetical protein
VQRASKRAEGGLQGTFEKGLKEDDRGVTLSLLKPRIEPADSHFVDEAKDEQGVLTPAQRANMKEVHELLQAGLVSISGKGSDGQSATAKRQGRQPRGTRDPARLDLRWSMMTTR